MAGDAVADDGGGVAEELLDVALVLVAGRGLADGAADAQRLDEVGDGARRGVAVVEAGPLEPAVVDAAAVAEQVEQLGRQLDAEAAQRAASRPMPIGGSGKVRFPQMAATSLQGSRPSPATL